MNIFAGKKAVIIGGSGGIGAGLSLKLAQAGAELVVHGGHDSEKLEKLLKKLNENSPSLVTHRAILQELKPETLIEFPKSPLMEEVTQADILCVAFGPFLQKSLEETSVSQWVTIPLMNYSLPGICVSGALPHMKKNKWGRILLFGGTLTHNVKGYRTNAVYGGAKTAVCSLVKSVAMEYSSWGISCNGILPGLTETEYQSSEDLVILAQKNPSGLIISRDVVCSAAMMLLSTREINGALLNVDDGWNP